MSDSHGQPVFLTEMNTMLSLFSNHGGFYIYEKCLWVYGLDERACA